MSEALITVRQPWASAIFECGKDVENRSWGTAYRGRLWIHAAVRPYRSTIPPVLDRRMRRDGPRGVIIGSVTLVDVLEPPVRKSPSVWAQRGAYLWILADPRPLRQPIPWTGRLGIIPVDPADLRRRQMA